jgi:hypothetical protein
MRFTVKKHIQISRAIAANNNSLFAVNLTFRTNFQGWQVAVLAYSV